MLKRLNKHIHTKPSLFLKSLSFVPKHLKTVLRILIFVRSWCTVFKNVEIKLKFPIKVNRYLKKIEVTENIFYLVICSHFPFTT